MSFNVPSTPNHAGMMDQFGVPVFSCPGGPDGGDSSSEEEKGEAEAAPEGEEAAEGEEAPEGEEAAEDVEAPEGEEAPEDVEATAESTQGEQGGGNTPAAEADSEEDDGDSEEEHPEPQGEVKEEEVNYPDTTIDLSHLQPQR